jgi:hypothetical protein
VSLEGLGQLEKPKDIGGNRTQVRYCLPRYYMKYAQNAIYCSVSGRIKKRINNHVKGFSTPRSILTFTCHRRVYPSSPVYVL